MADYNHWKAVAAQLEQGLTRVVADTATKGAGHVQAHISANGQIATGFMYSAVYASTSKGSTYGGGSPPGDSYRLPEAGPASKFSAFYGCAANYSIYQNNGTRFIPARPFFEPGVEETKVDLDSGLAALASTLGQV